MAFDLILPFRLSPCIHTIENSAFSVFSASSQMALVATLLHWSSAYTPLEAMTPISFFEGSRTA